MAKDNAIAAKLPSVDDLFGSPPVNEPPVETENQVVQIDLDLISSFPNHPFKVKLDEDMEKLIASVKQHGFLLPAIIRPKPGGDYEMVAGHRRQYACRQAGLTAMPALIREMDDDAATILMCDSNLQREKILPSECAWAYKLKYDAMKRQGARADLTSSPVETKLRTDEKIAENNDSRAQVQRYIHLTNLIQSLLDLVDAEKIAFRPAVELSYLTKSEQADLLELINLEESTPSLAQSIELKKLSQNGTLTPEKMLDLVRAPKPNQAQKLTFKSQEVDAYFPKSYTPTQRHDLIIDLLKKWQRNREREKTR